MQTETQMRNRESESGFTLIELSIVLVIIGLIVGGVLVGQEMIRAAQVRAVVAQIEKYNTAVNTFRNKYGGIPGDLSNTTTFFNYTTAANGDGNALLTDTLGTVNNTQADFDTWGTELANFWPSLTAANLVDGTYVVAGSATPLAPGANMPQTKLGRAGILAMALNGLNRFHVGVSSTADLTTAGNLGTAGFSNASLTPNEAYQMDVKIDDGNPNAGTVLGKNGTTSTAVAAAPTTSATACQSSATAYNVSSSNGVADNLLCQLQIRMN